MRLDEELPRRRRSGRVPRRSSARRAARASLRDRDWSRSFPPGRVERPDAARCPSHTSFSASPPVRASRRRDPVAFDVSVDPPGRARRPARRRLRRQRRSGGERSRPPRRRTTAGRGTSRTSAGTHRGARREALQQGVPTRNLRGGGAREGTDAAVGDAAGLGALGAQADVAPPSSSVLLEEVGSAAERGEDAGFEGLRVRGGRGGRKGFDGGERNPGYSELADSSRGSRGRGEVARTIKRDDKYRVGSYRRLLRLLPSYDSIGQVTY